MPAEWAISVAQLNEYVRKLLSGDPMLREMRVRGEISGFKKHVSGHLYFTLKDEQARVQCVMFKQNALYLNFSPRDGMRVTVKASASLYAQSGAYQLYVDEMKEEGAGELYLRFEMLRQKLAAEGLFDPARKKPVPMLPKTIGVVTSRTGAVLRDIVRVAGRRNRRVNILLAASAVQGAPAAGEIVAAIEKLNRDGRADVILVGRGGGSIEDLWPFNEEIVARAIAASRIPVISCVGHETDFTIADFVADLRAPTPSAAAELAVPVLSDLENTLDVLSMRMLRALMGKEQLLRAQLERLTASPALSDPHRLIAERAYQVDLITLRMRRALAAQTARTERQAGQLNALTVRLDAALTRSMETRHAQTDALARALAGLNPAAVMERGYAVIRSGGQTLSGVTGLTPGDLIEIRMKDGVAAAVVTDVQQ